MSFYFNQLSVYQQAVQLAVDTNKLMCGSTVAERVPVMIAQASRLLDVEERAARYGEAIGALYGLAATVDVTLGMGGIDEINAKRIKNDCEVISRTLSSLMAAIQKRQTEQPKA